jgi:hypothetical protein
MADRTESSQSIHDTVIEHVGDFLNLEEFNIFLNPNGLKNAGINQNYPDIILTDKATNNVSFIIEVETADSINANEAKGQWKKYADEIQASFYLLIPQNKKTIAVNLCRLLNINARFGTYEIGKNGEVLNVMFE